MNNKELTAALLYQLKLADDYSELVTEYDEVVSSNKVLRGKIAELKCDHQKTIELFNTERINMMKEMGNVHRRLCERNDQLHHWKSVAEIAITAATAFLITGILLLNR